MGCCASHLGVVSREEFHELKKDLTEFKEEVRRDIGELKKDVAQLKKDMVVLKRYVRIRRMYFRNRYASPQMFRKNFLFMNQKFGMSRESYRSVSLLFFLHAERMREKKAPHSSAA